MAARKFVVIDGCPAPIDVAPYIYLVLRKAGQTASSIGRGNDPEEVRILNRHGKHSQAQLWNGSPAQRAAWGVTGIPNRPGYSQHERRDSSGRPTPTWRQGVDSGPNTDANRRALRAAAAHYGLEIEFPYNSVVEYHHWVFKKKPTYDGKRLYKRRVVITRALLRTKR